MQIKVEEKGQKSGQKSFLACGDAKKREFENN